LRLLARRHRDMARLGNKHCSRLHALLIELEAGGIGTKISVANASGSSTVSLSLMRRPGIGSWSPERSLTTSPDST
jgi:hypothetical protein